MKDAKRIQRLLDRAYEARGPKDKKQENERWRKSVGAQALSRPDSMNFGFRGALAPTSPLQQAHADPTLKKAILEKSKYVGIGYNKGTLQYLGSKQDALDAGKK